MAQRARTPHHLMPTLRNTGVNFLRRVKHTHTSTRKSAITEASLLPPFVPEQIVHTHSQAAAQAALLFHGFRYIYLYSPKQASDRHRSTGGCARLLSQPLHSQPRYKKENTEFFDLSEGVRACACARLQTLKKEDPMPGTGVERKRRRRDGSTTLSR